MTKKEIEGVFYLILIGAPIAGLVWLVDNVGYVVPVLVIVAIIALVILHNRKKRRDRIEYLMGKYGDEDIVAKMMDGTIWVGQTDEELLDSIGSPVDIDQKVLKTKKKEVWKYHHQGGNRYGLRITLDNDEVVGWDEKM